MGIHLGLIATVISAISGPQSPMLQDMLPFGVAQHTLPSQLGCVPLAEGSSDATGQYVRDSVPEPDPIYEEYILAFVKGVGLCNLVAITPYHDDDERGTLTRSIFSKVTAMMSKELGVPDEKVDVAHTPAGGSDFLFKQAITEEERQMFNQWNGLQRRFRNLQSASVVLVGDSDYGLAVYSIYRYRGNDACLRRMEGTTGLSADQ